MRIAAGLHPHNAKYWGPETEERLRAMLHDKRTSCLGEIGLDYHYDLSPREDQERAFRAQVRIAKEAGLPVMLHIREAHDDALAIMREAEPYLTVIHIQLRQTLVELHNLSFASDTPPDALAVIGRRLIRLRTEAIRELQRISAQMEKLAGFNPGWGARVRGTKMEDLNPQPLNEQSVE